MPLTQWIEHPTKAQGWFGIECDHDFATTEEANWDFRHAVLKGSSYHQWFTSPDKPNSWITNAERWEGASRGGPDYLPVNAKAIEARIRSEWIRDEFETLSKVWQRDTKHLSLVSKKIAHPAYLRIIGMGQPAIPLILDALRLKPTHWFAALRAIANTDPSEINDSPFQAREAWLNWGTMEGYTE